ncbi:DMT family transporter [Acidaminobacter sp. JC074]|uniref:DMT family transporter n=1 Tax=Acidaminobacter sp. JC074 TaxID=2530199 RepID=UPI001F0CF0CA|nr:DMT family transporter [Acidaminobacter sp. JC074]MCH4888614.1 DMT family transporter [Acidaminobacter sp. JC074]
MDKLSSKKKQYLSDISLFFVAAVWGGGFVAVKGALDTMTPFLLMAYRFVLASSIVYLFFHKKIGKISKEDLKVGAVVGSILYLAFATQTFGLQYTTASKQGFLTATYVVMVPILYWLFYKKRPKNKAILGSVLTIAGIAMVSLNKSLDFNPGDALTLLCALFFAAHIIALEYYTKSVDVLKLTFLQLSVAALLFVVSALLFEPLVFNLTGAEISSIVYLAVFSTFLCYTVQTAAQKYTSSSHASIIMSLESVFAAVFGVLLLNEVMTPLMIMGCLLIFAAILIIEVDFKKKSDTIQVDSNELRKQSNE